MKPRELKSMSVDELWSLHELVSAELARKIPAETARLEQRLRQLGQVAVSHSVNIKIQRAAVTRRLFRNIEIPRNRSRLGRAAGRSHAGWLRSLSRENRSTIFGSIWRRRKLALG